MVGHPSIVSGRPVIQARSGHKVVATMRNPAGSSELSEQAAKERLPIRIETMDVDSDESVKRAFERILLKDRWTCW